MGFKMSKLLKISALSSMLAFALVGCGTGSGSGNAPSNSAASNSSGASSSSKHIVIGFSQSNLDPWRIAMTDGNKKYAAANYPNVDLVVTNGQGQASKQVADVEDLIARKVNVLMISPYTEEALTPVVKKAMDAGIPVVTLDRGVNTPVTAHIGAENLPIAKQDADFLAKKLNGHGNVIEVQGVPGASATVDRDKGFREEIAKYPGIKIVATQYCNYNREPAMKYMEDMIQRFAPGQFNAVYTHNDEMALGVIQALKAANRLKGVTVVSIDGENAAFQAIKNGELAATNIYPFCAPEGIEYAYKIAMGEKVPSNIVLNSQLVDASNVDQWLGKGF